MPADDARLTWPEREMVRRRAAGRTTAWRNWTAALATVAARLNLRASARQDALVRQAAAAVGKNVTAFVLDAACSAAEDVLADRRRFVLDDAAWRRFLRALDRPVRTKPRLRALLQEPGTVERA